MTRQIIDDDEGYPLVVNTYAGGELGECVQVTILRQGVSCNSDYGHTYATMTRRNALKFFELALKRLKKQIERDKIDPPWWQIIQGENK